MTVEPFGGQSPEGANRHLALAKWLQQAEGRGVEGKQVASSACFEPGHTSPWLFFDKAVSLLEAKVHRDRLASLPSRRLKSQGSKGETWIAPAVNGFIKPTFPLLSCGCQREVPAASLRRQVK
jgi:hypothetical protein